MSGTTLSNAPGRLQLPTKPVSRIKKIEIRLFHWTILTIIIKEMPA